MRYSIRITSSLTGATLAFLSLGMGASLADDNSSPTPPTPSPLPWSIANQTDKRVQPPAPKPWAVTTPTDSIDAAAQAVGKAAVQLAPKSYKSVHTRTVTPRRTAAQSRREVKAAQSPQGATVRRVRTRTQPLRAGSTVRIRGRAHVVRQGETMSQLFPGSWRRIARLNGISNPNRIFVGQVIVY